MNLAKTIACVAGLCLVSTLSFAQQQVRSETTVEDKYLSSVEDVIITELAASDEYDNKLVSLSYLESAVANGRQSPEMMTALSGLAGEGVTKQARTNGRVMNNYPDVRKRACDLLGEIKTEESKTILYGIAYEDTEPMVVAAAIRSLGKVGINNDDEVVKMIEFVHRKYATLNPTSSLALEVLNSFEMLAPTVQDKGSMIQTIGEIAQNYKYATPVRTRALELLRSLQSSSASRSGDAK